MSWTRLDLMPSKLLLLQPRTGPGSSGSSSSRYSHSGLYVEAGTSSAVAAVADPALYWDLGEGVESVAAAWQDMGARGALDSAWCSGPAGPRTSGSGPPGSGGSGQSRETRSGSGSLSPPPPRVLSLVREVLDSNARALSSLQLQRVYLPSSQWLLDVAESTLAVLGGARSTPEQVRGRE